MTDLHPDDVNLILTALHERKNRLVKMDTDAAVNESAVPTLRARISECSKLIRKLTVRDSSVKFHGAAE